MKTYLHALAMCHTMFSAIPGPQIWDEKARGKLLLFLPIVGLEIGAIWAALWWLSGLLELPALVRGLILSAYPYIITGSIHLDGFMDVTDAVRSWRDPQRRREILKDPHVGSFAVIGVTLVLLAQFALFSSAPEEADGRISIFIPVVSRCCSALAVTVLPPMPGSQYAQRIRSTGHIWVLSILLTLAVAGSFLLCGRYGLTALGCVAGFALALYRAFRSLEGMNGDISGYALTIGELCAVAVYALI